MKRYRLKRLFLLLLLPLTAIITMIAKSSPEHVEKYFSKGIYAVFAPAINVITSVFTFSVAEYIIYGVVIAVVVYLARTIIKIASASGEERVHEIYINIVNLVVAISVVFFVFTITFGLNYYRIPFTKSIGLTVDKYTDDDLKNLANKLVEDANKYREEVTTDENNIMILSRSKDETADVARKSMNRVANQFEGLQGIYQQPKPIKNSKMLSYLGITGFYFPITFEANINIDTPDYGIPHTMMHELSHVRGYMQEEEANFIGYLSCMAIDDPEFRYSASLTSLNYTLNTLSKIDPDGYQEVVAKLSQGVINDRKSNREYWAKFEGKTQEIANNANDIYLKAHSQKSGTKSYGQMVDLLIAYDKMTNQ